MAGSAEFKISWKGITDAGPLLTPDNYDSTASLVAEAVTARLTATGYSGVVPSKPPSSYAVSGSGIAALLDPISSWSSCDIGPGASRWSEC